MNGMESFGFVLQGEKRASSTAWDMSDAKATRPDSGDSWTCTKCNSVNFSGRTVCFMRYCKAPMPMAGELPAEPWFCPNCGNENFATRVFCNLRKCQKPRPNATFQEIHDAMQQGQGQHQGQGQGSAMPAVQLSMGSDKNSMLNAKAASVEGSWQCGICGTVNFPGRTHCNSNRCGRLRQEVDAGPPASLLQAGAAVGQFGAAVGQFGADAPGFFSTAMPDVGLSFAEKNLMVNAKAAVVEGSWQCGSCGTVNFPQRTHCNSNKCGRPRQEVDAGPPAASLQSAALIGQLGASAAGMFSTPGPDVKLSMAPDKNSHLNAKAASVEGSWQCGGCGTVNFPVRTHCNSYRCGRPREEVDTGHPVTSLQACATLGQFAATVGQMGADASGSFSATRPDVSLSFAEKNLMVNAKAAEVEGSWQCGSCGTVNFPQRSHCNSYKCGRPRQEVDAGPPVASLQSAALVGQLSASAAGTFSIHGSDVNHDKTLHLNAKAASVEGSWQCGGCGTVNFPGRTHCNSNRCGRPREEVDTGHPVSSLPTSATVGQFGATVGQFGADPTGFLSAARPDVSQSFAEKNLMVNARAAVVEGSWQCGSCGTVNFPQRTHCNSNKCGRPRQEVDAGPPSASLQSAALVGQLGANAAGTFSAAGTEAKLSTATDKNLYLNSKAAAVEGSWQCGGCGTVNFPGRTHCNSNRCGRPREEVDTGYPVSSLQAGATLGQFGATVGQLGADAAGCFSATRPDVSLSFAEKNMLVNAKAAVVEGSWQCGICGTVNFPQRTHCNSNKCGRPREEVDAGPPASSLQACSMVGQFGADAASFQSAASINPSVGMPSGGSPAAGVINSSLYPMQAATGVPEGSWVCSVASM